MAALWRPECSRWRFERAHSKSRLIKGAFHLRILPRPATPEMLQRSDAKRLTAEALMTSVYAGATDNKHGNNGSGVKYSSALTTSQDAEWWFRRNLSTFPDTLDHGS